MSEKAESGKSVYDPFSAETLADPFPGYAALRATCPVHRTEFTPPFFTLSRYEDVRDALADPTVWSIRYGQSPQYTKPAGLVNDPPEHTAFRQLFSRAFTPRTVEQLEEPIGALADELLDAMLAASDRAADFHDAYACPLPTIVIAQLLGIPPEDLPRFKQMSNDLTATYNLPDPRASAAPRAAFDEYFSTVIAARRAEPRDDLVSRLAAAEVDGRRLSDHELQWMLLLLLLGGNETSTALLTNVVWRLLEVPERWEALRTSPELVDGVVEESLRHDPPVLGLFRTPTRDVPLHGVTIPEKSKVMLCYASANRDEAVFDDAETFRLERPVDETRRHLSFGFGAHFCPGAALARLEARVTLERLVERVPSLRLAGAPERIVPFNLWGRRTLPVAW
ncbi:MAG TPA: cytochrome P450 [Acidimicrobiia bacterium]|nr:cytochrome P450 [Acidimicrobiia bacterium]